MTARENEAAVRRMLEEVKDDHDSTHFEDSAVSDHFDRVAVPEHRHGTAGEEQTSRKTVQRPP